MQRNCFHKMFKCPGPVVLPVIHVLDNEQALRNARTAVRSGAQGVFLINHDFAVESFLPIIRHVRKALPSLWLGVNFLAVTGRDAFPVLADLKAGGCRVDAYWADDARIDEKAGESAQAEAQAIAEVRGRCGWDGLYFGGTAFKKQRHVEPVDYAAAARLACRFMDVVTTSGVATGHAVEAGKAGVFRQACEDTVLALASGITPDNALDYAPLVDAFLVATGINIEDDFYNIDAAKLHSLLELTRNYGAVAPNSQEMQ